jgi:hypothetical protein
MLWNTFNCGHYLNEDPLWLLLMHLGMQAMRPWRLTLHTPKKTLEVEGNIGQMTMFLVPKSKRMKVLSRGSFSHENTYQLPPLRIPISVLSWVNFANF